MMLNQKQLNKKQLKEEKFQKIGKDFTRRLNHRLKMTKWIDGTLPLVLWETELKI